MSNQVIIHPGSGDSVIVTFPTPDYLTSHTIQDVVNLVVAPGEPYEIINRSQLPVNGSFRDAWEADFSNYRGITTSLEKAKTIYKQTADSTAATLSQPLTQEYMRLLAIGGDTTAVQAQLQAINAAAEETAYLDATTVDELIACWPPELGPNPFLPAPAAE